MHLIAGTTVTPHYSYRTPIFQKLGTNAAKSVAADTQDNRNYRTKSCACNKSVNIYTNWNSTTWQLDHLQVATSLYSLLLSNFTMRFVPFVIAGATLILFNTYAYAKPITVTTLDSPGLPGHLAPWCDGYNETSCHVHCTSQGFPNSQCTSTYVQMPSYKLVLTLTCKSQFLWLRVSYYPHF